MRRKALWPPAEPAWATWYDGAIRLMQKEQGAYRRAVRVSALEKVMGYQGCARTAAMEVGKALSEHLQQLRETGHLHSAANTPEEPRTRLERPVRVAEADFPGSHCFSSSGYL